MADATVIREFLVKLGWQTDEGALRRATDQLANFTRQVVRVGASIEAMALGAVAAVGRLASSMEQLYFVAARTGATVQGIQSLSYAYTQMGLSAGQAHATLEGLASFLRSSPGAAGMLQMMGVNPNQPSNRMVEQLGNRFAQMPVYLARQYASMMGIDERTLLVLRQGVRQYTDEYDRMAARIGVDSKQAAESGHTFMTAYRSLTTVFDLVGQKVEQTLGAKFGASIQQFREFILENAGQIVQVLNSVISVIMMLADIFTRLLLRTGQIVTEIVGWWNRLDSSTKSLIALFVAAGAAMLAPWSAVVAAILLLYDDYKTFVEYGQQYSLLPWGAIISGVNSVIDVMRGPFKATITFLGSAFDALETTAVAIWPTIKQASIDTFDAMESAAVAIWPTIKQASIDAFAGFKDAWPALFKSLQDAWEGFAQTISAGWHDIADVLQQLSALFFSVGTGIESPRLQVRLMISELVTGLANAVNFIAPIIIDTLGLALRTIVNLLKLVLDILRGDWKAAWNDMRAIAEDAIGFLIRRIEDLIHAWQALKTLFSSHPEKDEAGAVSGTSAGTTGTGTGVALMNIPSNKPVGAELQNRANEIMDSLIKQLNLTPAQAAGLTARFMYESHLDPGAFNPEGGNHGALGLAQHRGPRQEALVDYLKQHPEMSPLKGETQFIIQELHDKYSDVLGQIRSQDTAAGASIASYGYEGGGTPMGAMPYAQNLLAGYTNKPAPTTVIVPPTVQQERAERSVVLNQTNNVTVNGATDPHAAADAVTGAYQRQHADALRSLQGAVR